MKLDKKQNRLRRARKARAKIAELEVNRLSIHRTPRHIYAQVIDGTRGQTLVAASSLEKAVQASPDIKNKKSAANLVGKLVAERALEKGVKQIVFDRNGFLYHGRVKAVSDGARETGLEF